MHVTLITEKQISLFSNILLIFETLYAFVYKILMKLENFNLVNTFYKDQPNVLTTGT